jgi:hypothetical protein
VLTLAAAGVARCVAAPRRGLAAAGVLIAVIWTGAALADARREAFATGEQVNPEMLQIRSWAARLPPGASVRVDVPPSGDQLWVVYLLGSHPVDAPQPVLHTTYAHATFGLRADYSLALRYRPTKDPRHPVAISPQGFAVGPPVFQNDRYVLRRIAWPRTGKWASFPRTASDKLVES